MEHKRLTECDGNESDLTSEKNNGNLHFLVSSSLFNRKKTFLDLMDRNEMDHRSEYAICIDEFEGNLNIKSTSNEESGYLMFLKKVSQWRHQNHMNFCVKQPWIKLLSRGQVRQQHFLPHLRYALTLSQHRAASSPTWPSLGH